MWLIVAALLREKNGSIIVSRHLFYDLSQHLNQQTRRSFDHLHLQSAVVWVHNNVLSVLLITFVWDVSQGFII